MPFRFRSLLPAVCLAAAAVTSVAHADTFTGVVYNDAANGGVVVNPSTLPFAYKNQFSSTFTVSSFSFNSVVGGPSTGFQSYMVGGFLAGGNNLLFNDLGLAGVSMANTEFVFTGNVNLVKGNTYTFDHDDGLVLMVNGANVINAPGTTVDAPSSFTYNGPTGVASFVLEYGENGFPPADLNGPFTPATVTPEPSSIMLLGSGLVGLAGMVRRRFKA